jgi:hypothetical protein
MEDIDNKSEESDTQITNERKFEVEYTIKRDAEH